MKEFISKWSNWWILSPQRKGIDAAFEKELNDLIKRELELRQTSVSLECEHPYHSVSGDGKTQPAKCLKCGKVLENNLT
jgi:hypothetical protein